MKRCVYDHMDRRGDREFWNIANDYVVNMDLVENNIGKRITKADIALTILIKLIRDEVYDDLFENAEHVTQETLDIALDSVTKMAMAKVLMLMAKVAKVKRKQGQVGRRKKADP